MRAVMLRRHGGPGVLRVSEQAAPAPEPGQVAVRVRFVGVNYAEVLSRKGLYGWAPPLPYVPGMEAFGEIAEVGPGVARSAGERVIVGAQHGCYAERVAVPEAQALPALGHLSDEENAAFAVNYLTAWIALVEMARMRPSDRVLVTAAAGGVGTAAVQLAKRFGCTVVGAAGSPAKLPRIVELGADRAVSYGQGDLLGEVRRALDGGGVDVALEVVGGRVFRDSLELLEPFGRLVVAGYASLDLRRWNPLSWWRTWRDAPRADVRGLAVASRGLLATHIGYLLADPPRLRRLWEELAAFAARHAVRPAVGARFPFERVADAHRLMESRNSVGKILLSLG